MADPALPPQDSAPLPPQARPELPRLPAQVALLINEDLIRAHPGNIARALDAAHRVGIPSGCVPWGEAPHLVSVNYMSNPDFARAMAPYKPEVDTRTGQIMNMTPQAAQIAQGINQNVFEYVRQADILRGLNIRDDQMIIGSINPFSGQVHADASRQNAVGLGCHATGGGYTR